MSSFMSAAAAILEMTNYVIFYKHYFMEGDW